MTEKEEKWMYSDWSERISELHLVCCAEDIGCFQFSQVISSSIRQFKDVREGYVESMTIVFV